MFMTMRSFKLVVAGIILGVGVPFHVGMMDQAWVISWALLGAWAVLLIAKYAAQERAVISWVKARLDEIRKEKDDA